MVFEFTVASEYQLASTGLDIEVVDDDGIFTSDAVHSRPVARCPPRLAPMMIAIQQQQQPLQFCATAVPADDMSVVVTAA